MAGTPQREGFNDSSAEVLLVRTAARRWPTRLSRRRFSSPSSHPANSIRDRGRPGRRQPLEVRAMGRLAIAGDREAPVAADSGVGRRGVKRADQHIQPLHRMQAREGQATTRSRSAGRHDRLRTGSASSTPGGMTTPRDLPGHRSGEPLLLIGHEVHRRRAGDERVARAVLSKSRFFHAPCDSAHGSSEPSGRTTYGHARAAGTPARRRGSNAKTPHECARRRSRGRRSRSQRASGAEILESLAASRKEDRVQPFERRHDAGRHRQHARRRRRWSWR